MTRAVDELTLADVVPPLIGSYFRLMKAADHTVVSLDELPRPGQQGGKRPLSSGKTINPRDFIALALKLTFLDAQRARQLAGAYESAQDGTEAVPIDALCERAFPIHAAVLRATCS